MRPINGMQPAQCMVYKWLSIMLADIWPTSDECSEILVMER
jgi:hypothetical protein